MQGKTPKKGFIVSKDMIEKAGGSEEQDRDQELYEESVASKEEEPKTKHPGGRPSKYKPEIHIPIAKTMAKMGAIDDEIAKELEIDVATLRRWKRRHSEFCESLKIGKEVANQRVEDSLYMRAIGYEVEEIHTHIKVVEGKQTREIRKIKRHIIPDVTAQIYWTKNRDPERWTDVKKVHFENSLTDLLNKVEEDED